MSEVLNQLTDLAQGVNGSKGLVLLSAPLASGIARLVKEKKVGVKMTKIGGNMWIRGCDLCDFVNECHEHMVVKPPEKTAPIIEQVNLQPNSETEDEEEGEFDSLPEGEANLTPEGAAAPARKSRRSSGKSEQFNTPPAE